MRKELRLVLVSALAALFAMVGAPRANAQIFCPPNLGDVVVSDTIVVDGICRLEGTTVNGEVVVSKDGVLTAVGVVVLGDVIAVSSAKRMQIFASPDKTSEVHGNIEIAGIENTAVIGTFVGGDVMLRNNITAFANSNHLTGGMTIKNNEIAQVFFNIIEGDLVCVGNDNIRGVGNLVNGLKEGQCADF